ncbi:MAG TPA: BON domain-containing protein [Bryobacteraceae bacterium]|nr:BON domain-containing protein [Bryobacteraceae bacterium]
MNKITLLSLTFLLAIGTACTQSERNRTNAAAERAGEAADRTGERAREGAARAGRATERGVEKAGEHLDNAALAAKVKTKLAGDVRLSTLTSIDVDVNDGVVTLNGTVPTSADRRLAETVVANSEGVRKVVNNLKVRP